MKRAAYGLALVVAAFFLGAPSQASAHGWHGHRKHVQHYRAPRVVVGFGSGFWWAPRVVLPSPPLIRVRPPRVIVETPPVYIERRARSSSSCWR